MDSISKARLTGLHPILVSRLQQLDQALEVQGIPWRITSATRSWAEQHELWLKGRDDDGNIIDPSKVVTRARPGHSWHNYSLAVDVVPMPDGEPDWDISSPYWRAIFAALPAVGLRSGNEFKSFRDPDHVQPEELPESPTGEDIQLLVDGGVQAVWEKYFPDVRS